MKKISLESRVATFIERHDLMPPGEMVVVAVSGGADSVCLLHILAGLRRDMNVRLHVAHLNHQLRGAESEAEARYVSDLARSLGLPATISSQDVAAHRTSRRCSLEEAAREVRYAFLAGVAGEMGATRIATGHTRNDQVETILMHILRGAGTAGLSGLAPCTPLAYDADILPFRGTLQGREGGPGAEAPVPIVGGLGAQPPVLLLLIRPLLEITREDTTRYCRQHGLEPCEDSSNRSPLFLRNRLRLELLPLLRQYNPSIDGALLRLADIAGEDNAFVEQQAAALWQSVARQEDDVIHLDRQQLAALHVALQRRLVKTALAKLVGDPRDIEAVHIEAARSLLSKPVGKEVHLPHGLVCRAGYDELVVTREPPAGSEPPGVITTQSCCESGHVRTKQFHGSVAGFIPAPVGSGLTRRVQDPPLRPAHPPRAGTRPAPTTEESGAGQPAPCGPCILPLLPGAISLEVPGETFLPGWRVTASIMPRGECERHCEARLVGTKQPHGLCANHTVTRPPLRLPRHPDSIGTPRNDSSIGGCAPKPPAGSCLEGARPSPTRHKTPPHSFGVAQDRPLPRCDSEDELLRQDNLLPNADGPFAAYLDLAEAGTQFMVRQRRPGDRFQPLGMGATKKLQDSMADARIPRAWRQHIPLVCSPQHILWVVGWRIDDRVKVTDATEQVLRLEFARCE